MHARRPRHAGQLCLRWLGLHEHGYVRHALLLSPAMPSNGAGKNPVNPLAPPLHRARAPTGLEIDRSPPRGRRSTTPSAGSPFSTGAYGRDAWPGGKKPLDIHVIYTGAYREHPELAAQRECRHRGLPQGRLRVGRRVPSSIPRASTATLCCPWPPGGRRGTSPGCANCRDGVLGRPHYGAAGSRRDPEGRDRRGAGEAASASIPQAANTMTDAERTYYSFAGAIKMTDQATAAYHRCSPSPRKTLTPWAWRANRNKAASPSPSSRKRAAIRPSVSKGDALTYRPFEAFIADPVANPAATASGKFEIYSATLGSCKLAGLSPPFRPSRSGRSATPSRVLVLRPTPIRCCCGRRTPCVAPTR